MIKHIVMWRLKAEAEGRSAQENATLIKRDLEALNGRIPGLLRLEVGQDFNGGDNAADLVLYSELASRQALADYQAHPEHKAVAQRVTAASSERRVVDYEI